VGGSNEHPRELRSPPPPGGTAAAAIGIIGNVFVRMGIKKKRPSDGSAQWVRRGHRRPSCSWGMRTLLRSLSIWSSGLLRSSHRQCGAVGIVLVPAEESIVRMRKGTNERFIALLAFCLLSQPLSTSPSRCKSSVFAKPIFKEAHARTRRIRGSGIVVIIDSACACVCSPRILYSLSGSFLSDSN
jgi:hypothetical protein